MMGRLESIWIKPARGGPMEAREQAQLQAGCGITDNANQGTRQVTIIAQERWAAIEQAAGQAIDPATRRANLLVSGITLEESTGRVLQVGSCRIEIAGETWPCDRMEQALAGLKALMTPNWGGGACGQILEGGTIHLGDPVAWAASQA